MTMSDFSTFTSWCALVQRRRVKSDFLVSVRMISDFGVLERPLAQDGHSRFVVLRCMTWYSYTKVLFDVLLVVSLYR